jgi:tRNA nucleotidyltransferase (CCA-adding enzyme)
MNLDLKKLLPPELERILTQTPELRHAYLVGGCVRDALLGLPCKDFDVEVFGVEADTLVRALTRWGKVDVVGRAFGVVKLTTPTGATFDFSLPRRDSKVAPGHRGFQIQCDPGLSPREAAARRDFTFNALMYDPARDQVLDFFGGLNDLQHRVLRHTSPAFVEDPLRVLRGMQFAARFDLTPAPETVELCRQMKPSFRELAVERVRDEWFKWAAQSTKPSAGLRFLQRTEWLEHFPELHALVGLPQEPAWHPEGDVFTHTCHCCDALVQLPDWQQADPQTRIVLSFAVLTHDLGKALTTQRQLVDGQQRIVSPRHEEASQQLAAAFLERLRAPRAVVERVLPLVRHHMAHLQVVTDRSVRRLAERLAPATIPQLCVVLSADAQGRPSLPPRVPEAVAALLAKAAELQVRQSAPKPILMGRHLVALGLQPGPALGHILHAAYEAQLEGHFSSLPEAYGWLAAQPQLPLSEELRGKLRQAAGSGPTSPTEPG